MKRPRKPSQRSQKSQRNTGFFAYPSHHGDRAEIIEKAINLVNERESSLYVKSWTKMDRSSSRVISNILESIDSADFFLADISGLNPNVLFEAGYAFGKQKRMVLFTQGFSSEERSRDLRDLEMISGWDIGTYQNKDEMASIIAKRNPFVHKTQPELMKYGGNSEQGTAPERGLFLKGSSNAEMAVVALQRLRETFPQLRVDDWGEDGSQPLLWYVREVMAATGVVALFVDPTWDNGRRMNARFSFVCGLAAALGKELLMIGLPGFDTPFDYRELLVRPKDSDQTKLALHRAFAVENLPTLPNEECATNQVEKSLLDSAGERLDRELVLLDINIGNTIAENEEIELGEYFVQTGQYIRALKTSQAVIVGNKGSGKTAVFFQTRDRFQQHAKNLVCEIKPVDYRMARFLSGLKRLEGTAGAVGHVVESVWKLTIYCELLYTLYRQITRRPVAAGMSGPEQQLARFVGLHENLVTAPFDQKLDVAIEWLAEASYQGDKFTALIHDRFLSAAKAILHPLLTDVHRLVILVDNLDKGWVPDADLNLQTQVVFSLLGIHRRLRSDFGNMTEMSVLIFLRRNIFESCLAVARESDKLIADSIELVWNDPEMLLRVLKERFARAVESHGGDPEETPWQSFFADSVDGVPTPQWLYQSVLPRPRDLIHFVQKAIERAINRGHARITDHDLKMAASLYSAFAVEQVIAEYRAENPWLPFVLRSFAGGGDEFSEDYLFRHLQAVELGSGAKGESLSTIETLVSVGFLGIGFGNTRPTYASDLQTSRALLALVRTHSPGRNLRYSIHPVYHQHLMVQTGKVEGIPPADPAERDPEQVLNITSLSIIKQIIHRLFKDRR